MSAFPTEAQRQHFQQCMLNITEVLDMLKDDLPHHSPGSMHLFAYKTLNGNPEDDLNKRYKLGVMLHPTGDILLSGQELTTLKYLGDVQTLTQDEFRAKYTAHPERGSRWFVRAGSRPDNEADVISEQAEAAMLQFQSPQRPIGNWK